MKFIVEPEQEIKDSVIGEHVYLHVRTVGSFKEFDRLFSADEGSWESCGRNHKVIPARHSYYGSKKWISREEQRDAYTIEVPQLNDLVALTEYYGCVLIEPSDYVDVPWKLTFGHECD